MEGRAVARCLLRANSKASRCTIVQSSGSAALDAATLRLIDDMRWAPTAPGGQQMITVPVNWLVQDVYR